MPTDEEPVRITEIDAAPAHRGRRRRERGARAKARATPRTSTASSPTACNAQMTLQPTVEVRALEHSARAALQRLLTAPAPPGHEEAPAAIWREAAEEFADEVTSTPWAPPVARVDGSADHPLLAVVGHVDEIALLVSHVSDKGFLHVVGSGGWDPQMLVGQRVEVLTRDGRACRRGRAQADPPARGRRAQEGRRAEGPARGHRRCATATRRARLVRERRSDRDRRRALELPQRPARLARRSTTASASTWRSRWRAASARRAAAAGPVAARGGRPGGDRLARRARDGVRARAGPGRGGRRDARHRRPRRRARRARRARPRQRPGDHARSDRQPRPSTTCSTRPPRRRASRSPPRPPAARRTPTRT